MEHVMDCYVIWKFAKNIDGAKQFLVDYIDHFRDGFMNSQFYNFPCFPGTVPDLEKLICNDSRPQPPDTSTVLGNLITQATTVEYPDCATAAKYSRNTDRQSDSEAG